MIMKVPKLPLIVSLGAYSDLDTMGKSVEKVATTCEWGREVRNWKLPDSRVWNRRWFFESRRKLFLAPLFRELIFLKEVDDIRLAFIIHRLRAVHSLMRTATLIVEEGIVGKDYIRFFVYPMAYGGQRDQGRLMIANLAHKYCYDTGNFVQLNPAGEHTGLSELRRF